MTPKHLHELLKEDQEPFHPKSYVADRRFQLGTTIQTRKRKPFVNSSSTGRGLCGQACFFSFNDSPDVLKSPLPDFLSPSSRSHCKTPNGTVFLHVPPTTAALLLEAAMRIQKQSSCGKPKTGVINVGFGLFGSILKKLKDRNKNIKRELCCNADDDSHHDSCNPTRNIPRKCEKMKGNLVGFDDKSVNETCNNSWLSSAWWSDSNGQNSPNMENSSSCSPEDSHDIEFAPKDRENVNSLSHEKHLCSSPFRFPMKQNPSGSHTPDFSSPVTSPTRYKKEDEENYEAESLNKVQLEKKEKEQQCSPVSVLDPLFVDDDNGDEQGDENRDDYDGQCSYAVLKRAKQKLLLKLRRFEKLAELDSVELDKKIWEEDGNQTGDDFQEEDEHVTSPYRKINVDEFIGELFFQSSFDRIWKTRADMRKLVSDLIDEERREYSVLEDSEMVSKRVLKKLHSWKEVESNTKDMIVGSDFRREFEGRKKNEEQVAELVVELEVAVFGFLVEEFSEELVYLVPGV